MERLRKSTYKTSRFLTLYDEDENYIYYLVAKNLKKQRK